MHPKQHGEITEFIWGKSYMYIHIWIDEFYSKYEELGEPYLHWAERHHLDAIRKQFGTDTIEFKVAVLHVLMDWYSHMKIFRIPKDRREAIELLVKHSKIYPEHLEEFNYAK